MTKIENHCIPVDPVKSGILLDRYQIDPNNPTTAPTKENKIDFNDSCNLSNINIIVRAL
jgi:hypothetical protein